MIELMPAKQTTVVDFNAVLDEFKRQDTQWVGIAVVEASLGGMRFYRWMSDGRLGVSGNAGMTLRPATNKEYGELELGIAKGRVTITRYNRVTRKTDYIHQPQG